MSDQTTYKASKALLYCLVTVVIILVLDQWLKIYIKTNFSLGQEVSVIGDWFKLHFTENPGMAFGLTLGGELGKVVLTSFRIIASVVIIFYIRGLIREQAKTGLIILVSCILAGAMGNIFDSLFYGKIFGESTYHQIASYMPEKGGYAPIFMGKVVDMLYFPMIDTFLPDWVPFIGGQRFQFFRPVFNIADAAISTGVFTIIVFRRKLFNDPKLVEEQVVPTAGTEFIKPDSEL